MKICMIIANQDYQDKEYAVPKKIFEEAEFEVITCAQSKGIAQGSLGETAEIDLTLKEVEINEFGAIVFVGGSGAVKYIENVDAHMIAYDANKAGKVVAAICIAPMILTHAGILKNKKVTVWDKDGSNIARMESLEAKYVADKNVVVDDNIVTANGPNAAAEFGKAIVDLLKSK
jgi:protease I